MCAITNIHNRALRKAHPKLLRLGDCSNTEHINETFFFFLKLMTLLIHNDQSLILILKFTLFYFDDKLWDNTKKKLKSLEFM